jgi:hypothetical protein
MNGLVENAKGIVSITRDGVITLILILLLVVPATINKSLVSAGFKKGNIAGFEWEAVRDNVEDNNKKLGEATTTIETLQDQLTKTEAALKESETARLKLADQVKEEMPGTEAASLATAAPVPEANQIAAQNKEVLNKSIARSNIFRQQIQLNRNLLATVGPPAGN